MRSFTLLAVAFTILPAAGWAQVGGDPIAHSPITTTDMWVDMGNDNLVPGQPDDNLTGGLDLGLKVGDYVLGAGYEVMTHTTMTRTLIPSQFPANPNQGPVSFSGTRCDEGTLDVGRSFAWRGVAITASAGLRYVADLGGEKAQDWDHRKVAGAAEMQVPYDHREIRPIGIVDLSYRIGDGAGLLPSIVIATTVDSVEWDVKVPYFLSGGGRKSYEKVAIWIGPEWRHFMGHSMSQTQQWVHQKYDRLGGLALAGGFHYGPLEYSFTINHQVGYATIGANW